MTRRAYTKYKDSGIPWLGAVPEHWRVKRLKHTASLNDEALPETTEPDFEFTYVDIGSVDASKGITTTEPYRFENAPSRARRIVRDGDTIVSTVRTYLRAIAPIREPEEHLIVSTGFAVVRPRNLDSAYLSYALRAPYFVETVVSRSTGVSYPAINASDVGNIPISIPPLTEQRAIAAFLDRETARIDGLIEKKQRQIELLQEKRAALISHAVTKGLDPNTKMKPSGIEWLGDIPEHWVVTRLGWVSCEINDINHEMPAAVPEGVPFLSAKDLLDNGSINFERDIKLISEDDFCRLSRKVRPCRDDIIYSRIGACLGKARLVTTDTRFLVSYSCCVIRVDKSLALPRYFAHLLDTDILLTEARLRTQGIGVPDLGLREISRFPILLPPQREQARIADYLEDAVGECKSLTNAVLKSIDLLREYRTALISAAVTGKIDVRGEVDGTPSRQAAKGAVS